jgi:hypothetical protein
MAALHEDRWLQDNIELRWKINKNLTRKRGRERPKLNKKISGSFSKSFVQQIKIAGVTKTNFDFW